MNVNSINNVNFNGYNGKYLFKSKNISALENVSSKSIKDIVKNALKIKPKEEVAFPVVAVPILAYMQTHKDKIAEKLAKEAENKSNKYFTDNYKESVKKLKQAGVKGNYEKYIDSTTGRLNTSGNSITNTQFKGAPDDLYAQPADVDGDYIGDMPEVYDNDVPDDIPMTDNISTTDNIENLGNTIDTISVVGAAITEFLPLARYIKPIKDLQSGDTSKAAIGTATRIAEIPLAPLKFIYVGGMGLCSTLYKLAGMEDNEDKNERFVGFWNGVKLASKCWADVRDEIEDKILGRETKSEREYRLEQEWRKKMDEREEKIKQIEKARQERAETFRRKHLEEMQAAVASTQKEVLADDQQTSRAKRREELRKQKIEEEKRLLAEKEKERELAIERMNKAEKHPVEENSSNCTISAPKEEDSIPDELIEALCDRALPLMQLAKRINIYSELNRNFDFDEFVKETGLYDTNLEDFSVEEINRIRKILDERIKALKK